MKKIYQNLLILFFIAILFIPMFGLVKINNEPVENNSFIESKVQFERFFEDNLFKKQGMRTYFTRLQLLLGLSPAEDIAILGDHGFLFIANSNDLELDAYRGLRDFSDAHYENAIDHLSWIESFFTEQDIDFLLMIAPDKSTIYGDYLPKRISRTGITPRNTFMDFVNKNDISDYVLDLAPALEEAQKTIVDEFQNYLYYKGDSHWNNYGAFLAFEDYLNYTNRLDSEAADYPLIEAKWFEPYFGTNDLAELIFPGAAAEYTKKYPELEVVFETSPEMPQHTEERLTTNSDWRELFVMRNENAVFDETVFLFRDSFAFAQLNYFSYLYSEVYVVHYNRILVEDMRWQLEWMIESFEPDRVVLEIVERRIVDALLMFDDFSK